MNNDQLIETFYSSFSKGNPRDMTQCYHEDIVFRDPVFGTLKGERAKAMWHMLLSQKKSSVKINYDSIQTTDQEGSANWQAEYVYGEKKRNVTNKISASFTFKDGKIIKHIDCFDLWRWSQQAFGPMGYVLGWTPIMKNKIKKTVNKRLDTYMAKSR